MKKIIIYYFILTAFLLIILILIKKNFIKKTVLDNGNYGIEDVIKNIDNYAKYFKANHVNAQIETYKEKECLKITFDSGIEAIYGPELIKINKKILWQYYSKEILVDLEINNIDIVKNIAQVSIEYDGGYGTTVCYYLPEFYDIKPDWGDYLQADLDVKKIISLEDLKELYIKAAQMKEMINNEYLRRNDLVLQHK
jgi:hypothetical protein